MNRLKTLIRENPRFSKLIENSTTESNFDRDEKAFCTKLGSFDSILDWKTIKNRNPKQYLFQELQKLLSGEFIIVEFLVNEILHSGCSVCITCARLQYTDTIRILINPDVIIFIPLMVFLESNTWVVGSNGTGVLELSHDEFSIHPLDPIEHVLRPDQEIPRMIESDSTWFDPDSLDRMIRSLDINPDMTYLCDVTTDPRDSYRNLRKSQNIIVSLGVQYAKEDKYKEAIEFYKLAIEIDPDCADAYVAMGAAYVNQKAFPKGIQYFETALKIDSSHKNAKIYLEATHRKVKELDTENDRQKMRDIEAKLNPKKRKVDLDVHDD